MTGPADIVRLIQAGNLDEAVRAARAWADASPGDPAAWQHLGTALVHAGRPDEAHAVLDKGLAAHPDDGPLMAEKAFAFHFQGRHEESAGLYRRAMELGDNPVYQNGYGNALLLSNQIVAGTRELEESVRRHPEFAPARFNLIQAYVRAGEIRRARQLSDELVGQAPRDYLARENAVWPLLYDDEATPGELAQNTGAMGVLLPRQRDPRGFPNNRDPERRLRVGFVSPDFREHSVYRFLWPVLEALADHPVDLYAYAASTNRDRGTAHIASLVKKYEDITALQPPQLAKLMAADKIDILFDLAGHTLFNRLVDFSIRLAPLQINWIGYPFSTGVPAMDFRIVDRLTDPEGSWTSESPMVFEPCFLCFGPPTDAPEPVDQTDGPTFGSFNVLAKASPTTVELYAACLHAVPGSRLVMKAPALQDEELRSNLLDRFMSLGVEGGRVELLGAMPSYLDHLARYNRVTVALDPYPYHGTTTTCEAYAMGVPVVSLVGQTHQARVGLSLAHAVGRPEWACETREAYVATAARLATTWRANDRNRLRADLRSSVLTDAEGMAERLMRGIRAAWRMWCARR